MQTPQEIKTSWGFRSTSRILIKLNNMTEFSKKDLLLILNIYQNYYNDFVNITEDDITNMYVQIATEDCKQNVTSEMINTYNKNLGNTKLN